MKPIKATKEIAKRHHRKFRWGLVALVVLASIIFALTVDDWGGYLQAWGGTVFKGLSGCVIGWLISRYVIGLNLSQIEESLRPIAAISQAIIIAAFVIGVAK